MQYRPAKAIHLVLLIFLFLIKQFCTANQSSIAPNDFSQLKLAVKELQGSRWAYEQSKKVTVFHSFHIIDIAKVDINDMSVRVEFQMRQRWLADGLEFPTGLFKANDSKDVFIIAEDSVLKSVWSPASYLPNARETKIQTVAASQSAVNIFNNKTIVYKARMFTVLGCAFTFEWYPADIQTCDLVFESYKYPLKVVDYDWEKNPVTVDENIILYQYEFHKPPKYIKGNRGRRGNTKYPFVKVRFKFERKLGNNIIQIFTPTCLVVTLSFFSFWLGLDAVPGRITLLITCILTLVTMHGGLKDAIPPVNYINMMDIWMIGCMGFVFGAICEFVLVKYLQWRSLQKEKAEEEEQKYLKQQQQYFDGIFHSQSIFKLRGKCMQNQVCPLPSPPPNYHQIQNLRYEDKRRPPVCHSGVNGPSRIPPGNNQSMTNMHQVAVYDHSPLLPPPPYSTPIWVKIDKICQLLLPILFLAFNGAYWPILILGSAKQHENDGEWQ